MDSWRSPPLLPTSAASSSSAAAASSGRLASARLAITRRACRRPLRTALVASAVTFLLLLLNFHTLSTIRRDIGYIFRPLWDTPEPPFRVLKHFPPPGEGEIDTTAWCALHNWTARSGKPIVVDAVPVSTELDMLEVRWREYAPFVDIFIVVESTMTFAGTPKPAHFEQHRAKFEAIAKAAGAKLVYKKVTDFEPNLPSGSFKNEIKQRVAISDLIEQERVLAGSIPPGSLVIQSDVDEIISRDTLRLLTTCSGFPSQMHLSVDNYIYSFDQPLNDGGYWRPRVVTVPSTSERINYHHGRGAEDMLAGAGWHCTFCFPTLEDMRAKMRGYSHNDRLTSKKLLDEKHLRRRVCEGRDPFGMWPEAFTFRDVIAHSGPTRRRNSFLHVPVALKEDTDRFAYLLDKGCERPDKPVS
ncbi:hypothetical protein Q8F55_003303 [Vanrija albida]|uniref:Glycosyltransferase family 17 protein n=1 Tax=Vanrija albida TaxID=181172 RepID=A0ABR3Q463_9TREE